MDKIFDAMDYFLGVVGFVTLALGAIGIVNIMLVSVAERTREIGLRKALGATYQNILTQFFIEGAFLTIFSGGIGLSDLHGLCHRCWPSCPRRRDLTRHASCPCRRWPPFCRSPLPALWLEFIPREKPRCWPRSKP